MTVPDRLTISDIADLAGVGVSAVSNWRKRYSDFPVGRDDFDSGEVAGWLSKRKVPAKGLQPGEPVGTSYGDRLRARHGGPAARVSEEALALQLAPVLTRLRGLGDPVQHIAFLLGLLWLRRDDSRRWHDIVGESESERVRDRVLAARLPAGRGPVAPVIPDGITSDASLLQTVRGFAAVAVPDPATATRLHLLLLR